MIPQAQRFNKNVPIGLIKSLLQRLVPATCGICSCNQHGDFYRFLDDTWQKWERDVSWWFHCWQYCIAAFDTKKTHGLLTWRTTGRPLDRRPRHQISEAKPKNQQKILGVAHLLGCFCLNKLCNSIEDPCVPRSKNAIWFMVIYPIIGILGYLHINGWPSVPMENHVWQEAKQDLGSSTTFFVEVLCFAPKVSDSSLAHGKKPTVWTSNGKQMTYTDVKLNDPSIHKSVMLYDDTCDICRILCLFYWSYCRPTIEFNLLSFTNTFFCDPTPPEYLEEYLLHLYMWIREYLEGLWLRIRPVTGSDLHQWSKLPRRRREATQARPWYCAKGAEVEDSGWNVPMLAFISMKYMEKWGLQTTIVTVQSRLSHVFAPNKMWSRLTCRICDQSVPKSSKSKRAGLNNLELQMLGAVTMKWLDIFYILSGVHAFEQTKAENGKGRTKCWNVLSSI